MNYNDKALWTDEMLRDERSVIVTAIFLSKHPSAKALRRLKRAVAKYETSHEERIFENIIHALENIQGEPNA